MKLTDWLKAENLSMGAFGERVGVTHSAVSRWVSGDVFPPGDKLQRIREVTAGAVLPNDFMQDAVAANGCADARATA